MTNGGGLINLGGISKPATVLIEKISDAVGGIAKPWQIKRVARAEADAALIEANAKVQVSEIEQRALIRMVREEGKKQENIESITAQALPRLKDDAKPEAVEQDWLTHFFDRCRLISDQQMQTLWSNILAGEANAPGSFSKRTIELVSTLDKSDATLFSNFCSFVWMIETPTPLIFDIDNDIYRSAGITFDSLNHLESIGLISLNGASGYQQHRLPKRFSVYYHKEPVVIEMEQDNGNIIGIGKAILSFPRNFVCQGWPRIESLLEGKK